MHRPTAFLLTGLVSGAFLFLRASSEALGQYVFTTIDYPSASSTEANNIDAAGRIPGDYTDGGGVTHAFSVGMDEAFNDMEFGPTDWWAVRL